MQPEPDPKSDWARHALRINQVIDNQVRSLRVRQVIGSFEAKERKGVVQERLINWGYAACDAAMRIWVDPTLAKPLGFPFAATGIG